MQLGPAPPRRLSWPRRVQVTEVKTWIYDCWYDRPDEEIKAHYLSLIAPGDKQPDTRKLSVDISPAAKEASS